MSTALPTAAEAYALVKATPDQTGPLPSHVNLGSLKYARIHRPSGPSAQEQHAAALEAAVAEWAFADASFAALSDALKAEQRLLGLLLWCPALHAEIRCEAADFSDPCHQRIYIYAWALWRLRQSASANAVADCIWWVTPLLEGGDRLSPIEELVFETLCWPFGEYIIELERRHDRGDLLQ
jgi:hypothetical protein